MMERQDVYARLKALHEEHLLRFFGDLTPDEQQAFLDQLSSTDFSCLASFPHRTDPVRHGVFSPLPAMRLDDIHAQRDAFRTRGLEEAEKGSLGAVLLAGGMGTRLGADGPKGVFDIGVTHPVYIFQRIFENLMYAATRIGRPVHLAVMTSDRNDGETRSFLSSHAFFGYPADYVHFFRQEMAPAVDEEGHLLLEAPGRLATSPNGNGGWLRSMAASGILDLFRRDGVRWLNVFAVDNVLQNICDPIFFGATLESGRPCGAKVVRKAGPEEKVGVMCLEDGRPTVVEYYELTDEMRNARDGQGRYLYDFGVINNYLFRIEDAVRVMNGSMPLHFAHKKIDCIDEKGRPVHPKEPNGWKFEYFIFDLIHELDGCLPFEVERDREFAPIKNRTGVDSVESARALLIRNGFRL